MLSVVRCDFLSPYARISFAITTNDSIITIIIEIPFGWWMYDSFTYIKSIKPYLLAFWCQREVMGGMTKMTCGQEHCTQLDTSWRHNGICNKHTDENSVNDEQNI